MSQIIDGITSQFLSQLFEFNNIKQNKSHEDVQKLGFEGLVKFLDTNIKDGIKTDSLQNLEARKFKYGTNLPPLPKAKTFWHCCYVSTHDFCIRILILAAVLMIVCGFFAENQTEVFAQAFSIFCAVLAVIFIAGTTDWQKDQQYRELIKAANSSATVEVIRDGQQKEIAVDEILVGDILLVSSGSYLSVDGIYLQKPNSGVSLEVDESSLTGISEIIIKRPYVEDQYDLKENYFLRSGSNIYAGDGLMLVCCVGEHTMLGKIKSNIHEVNEFSYLDDTTAGLAKLMVYIGGFFSILMLCILLYWDEQEINEEVENGGESKVGLQKFLADFLAAFMILVFSVPEGLPLVITLTLANTVMELKKYGVQVRNLNSCTYLSGLDMICFDKTGTLTKNMMEVSNFYSENFLCETHLPAAEVTPSPLPATAFIPPSTIPIAAPIPPSPRAAKPALSLQTRDKLKDAIFSTNSVTVEVIGESDKQQDENAPLDQKKEIDLKLDGNKIDIALITFLKNNYTEINIKQEHEHWSSGNRIKQLKLLNSTPPIKMTVTALNEVNKYRVYYKGVKENMLERCKFFLERNQGEELAIIRKIDLEITEIIRLRVLDNKENSKLLILAYQDFEIANLEEEDWNDSKYQNDMIMIGLLNIQDEIRPGVKKAIQALKDYHVDSRMTTGDVREPSIHVATLTDILDPTADLSDANLILEAWELKEKCGITYDTKGEVAIIKEENQTIFKEILKKFKIIYNASAQDKQLVVQGLQQHYNHIVAYVGDGNNDVQALNCSNIGFVMGIGTPIAKESCNLILKSNELQGIVHAVEWGRHVFLNLQRFIFLQLTFFIVSAILMICSSLTIKDSPYSVLQIIWLSLIHDVFSSIALAFDKPVKDIGKNIKPIKRGQSLIDTYLLILITSSVIFQLLAGFFVLYYTPEIFGILPSEDYDINDLDTKFVPRQAIHYTIVFHTTTLLQIFSMPNGRNIGHPELIFIEGFFTNYVFWGITILCYMIQMLIVEYGGAYFKCASLNFVQNFFCHFVAGGTFVQYLVTKKVLQWMNIR